MFWPRRLRMRLLLWLLPLISGICTLAAAQSDFTIVVLPDTQYYAQNYPQIFTTQTKWIAANQSALNIQLVIGVGDIVNGNTTTEWTRADAAIQYIEAIPYMLAIGNHDYDKGDTAPLARLATQFNKYFGPTRYASKSYYKGNWNGSNENFYGIVNLGGVDYLVLALEFYPRQGAADWAGEILQENASLPAILVTHGYGYHNGRVTTCDAYNAEHYGLSDDYDGQKLWESFVQQYANIQLVLSGHEVAYKGVGRRFDIGLNGNMVNQVLADYQDYTNGGDGYLRIMTFHPSQGTIDVSTYSPYTNTSLTDSNNQFTLSISPPAPLPNTSITGHVADSSTCSALPGATVSAGGASTTTDKYGNYNLVVPGGSALEITVSKAGYASKDKTYTPPAGYSSNIDWALSAGGTTGSISGRVTDAATGSALSGATVSGPTQTTTAADGSYTLSSVAAGTYTVTAAANGYQSSSQTVSVTAGSTSSLNFALPVASGTGSISGTVTDAATGSPLSGATVSGPGQTTTAADGSYTLSSVAPGTYTVTAAANGYQSSSQSVSVTAGATSSINFALAQSVQGANGSLTGKVTSIFDGHAISGATVSYAGGSAVTDSSGAYQFASLPPGSYSFTASASGWHARTETATISGGTQTTLNFAISTAGIIKGTVSKASGTAISGATVTVSGGVIQTNKSITTSSAGAYSSSWIPVGNYTVTATTSSGTQSKSVTLGTGQTLVVNFTF